MNYASLLPAEIHSDTPHPAGAPPARWLVRLARLIPHARR